MFLQNYTKLQKKHEIMLNIIDSLSLIIWEPAIETWAQEINGEGAGTNRGPGELNSPPTLEIIL